MPQGFQRTDRIADALQRELAQLIQYELKDPRLTTLVTVAAVKVSRDLSYAKVYVTALIDEKQQQDVLNILNHAAGYLRSMLSQRIELRTIPKLTFVYDKSLQEGNRMSGLIDSALKRSNPSDDTHE